MKKIQLVPALALGNKLNVDVMDFPEATAAEDGDAKAGAGGAEPAGAGAVGGPAVSDDDKPAAEGLDKPAGGDPASLGASRKRCGITLDYAPRDIRELQAQGLDREGMLEYYRQRIYDLVKVNISQDWECVGGLEEVMAIVEEHL